MPEGEPNSDGAGSTGESESVDSGLSGKFQTLRDMINAPRNGGVSPGRDQYGVSTRE
jgi:hypothetical protein